MVAPAPTTLRIIDGCQGQSEAPAAKNRAFQMIAEEARATPDVVMDMYLPFISLLLLIVSYGYMLLYRVVLSERHISYSIV